MDSRVLATVRPAPLPRAGAGRLPPTAQPVPWSTRHPLTAPYNTLMSPWYACKLFTWPRPWRKAAMPLAAARAAERVVT